MTGFDTEPWSIRPGSGEPADVHVLREMLLEAVCWESGVRAEDRARFAGDPELEKWVSRWGRRGDRLIVAEHADRPVGAAWYRLWSADDHSYGFVDATTPELGVGVEAPSRGRGVGTALMTALIRLAARDGFAALSLSVDPRNPARRIYESLGFHRVGESGASWTYLLHLDAATAGDHTECARGRSRGSRDR